MDLSSYLSALTGFSIGTITLSNLLPALLVLVICLLIKRFLMKLAERAISSSKIDPSLHAFLRSSIDIGLLILIALIVADKLGIPVASLIAALGVIGLAVSLAVQNTLSNIAGGILILFSKPFAVGDYVEAGGVGGTVREIGLVYTKLATVDNKLISVPNGDISAAKITNYS
ncbi:MAG: small-conductance mechanosensitive channel, partial [Oscillospiraceae bacterium]